MVVDLLGSAMTLELELNRCTNLEMLNQILFYTWNQVK